MSESAKVTTLADMFVAIALERGVTREQADEFFSHYDRSPAFEAAKAITVNQAAAMIGNTPERMEQLVRRDLDRMMPRVH